jgi:Flp pilus assembly protein TadG
MRFRAGWQDKRGNVAVIFALTLVPMAVATGAGVDFARAVMVRSEMADALDAAGLAVGAAQGKSASQLQALAQSYFNANFTEKGVGTPTFSTTVDNNSATLTASVIMPTTLMSIVGIKTLPVSFTSTIKWGQTKLWVALALDNTGSMSETDGSGTSKMSALKSASHQLLTILQGAAANPGDVKVSIVPFNKDVNIGNTYGSLIDTLKWIDWTDWDAANTRQKCGYGDGNGNWTGNGWGYFSHGNQDNNGVGCTGTPDHLTWNGCITDRTQSYDTLVTTPDPAIPDTLFPADQYSSCPTQLTGLSDDWTALGNKIDAMYASGMTNQTIGFVWGWQTLTDGDPMNAGTLPSDTQRIIILLSDGLNTQNRWTSSQSSIDAREEAACDNAKSAGVIIYTVFVDLNGTSGNSGPLQYCASDSSKYFDLTTSGQIVTAFNTIGQQITNLRIAQ